MSSGGILILPVAAVLAAGAAVVLTAAAAAALTVWAANQAAEAALRALGNVGEKFEQTAAGQVVAEISALRWPQIAAGVIELNARIRLLSERASRAGVLVAVPEPLRLEGRSEQEVVEWTRLAAPMLRAANEAIAAGRAGTERDRLAAALPAAATALPDAAAALGRLQDTLRSRRAEATAPARPAGRGPDIAAILRTLDEDANENERLAALRTAALAERAGARDARSYARQLQIDVTELNARVARRRLAAQLTAALEDPVVVRTPPPAPYTGTARRLHAVLSGDADLTPELLAEAAAAVRWAESVARANFVREMVGGCLAEQGYTVDGEADVRHPAELRLSHANWHGEHSAEVWVDADGTVHGKVVREQDIDGDEAAMRDRARCDGFNADLSQLGGRLHAEVVIDREHAPQRRSRTGPATAEIRQQAAREIR